MPKRTPKLNTVAAFLLMTLALFLWGGAVVAQEKTARAKPFIVVVNNAPPFRIIESWGGEEGYGGAYIDMINEIGRRTELPLKFVNVPFIRALRMMEAGQADMMLGPTWSVERADYMIYLNASFPAEPKVFYLAPNTKDITRYRDLEGLRIGVLPSARYFDPFNDDESLTKVPVRRYELGFKMLARNRLDALIVPERQGEFLLRSFDYDFPSASFRVPGLPSFITISRTSRLLAHKEAIENTMAELNAEGYFQRLMMVYLD